MTFKDLSLYLERLEKTSSRLEITQILAELFRKNSSKEIDRTIYLLLGGLAPRYKGVVFNIAERLMVLIIAKAYGKEKEVVGKLYKKLGDLGAVAFEYAHAKIESSEKLSVLQVHERLLAAAKDQGEGSVDRKVIAVADILYRLDSVSAKFVARIPVGKLRLGFSDKTILDALSWMERGDKSGKPQLEKAYQVLPDVGLLARDVKEKGIDGATKNPQPKLGIPIMPMLAQRLKSPKDMIEKMKEVAVEPKFDGLRLQIHYKEGGFGDDKGEVKSFTRGFNEISWMFPELQEIGRHVDAREVILDVEAMGVDEELKALANFQQTMTRRRKHNIEEISRKTSIKFYVFDILYRDDKGLMDFEYLERRKVLEKTVKGKGIIEKVDFRITKNPEEINILNAQKRKEGLEGIIVKRINSTYIPGRTGWRWVKMKEAEEAVGKLADTVDAVVMGYYLGRGKRTGFGLGGFLAGVRDGENIKTVTKVGTGLTDKQFKELKVRLDNLPSKEMPKEYAVHKNLIPDVWVVPQVVVELAADDITVSPNHTAGYAMRFPRLVKFRDDKSVDQATTIKEVEKLYELQKH